MYVNTMNGEKKQERWKDFRGEEGKNKKGRLPLGFELPTASLQQ